MGNVIEGITPRVQQIDPPPPPMPDSSKPRLQKNGVRDLEVEDFG